MIYDYSGHFPYSHGVISEWNSNAIGVYYCGYPTTTGFTALYIGRATSDSGIRGRLIDHLREDNWPGVTHFSYRQCSTEAETIRLEADEIARCQPKYNTQGL